MLCWRLVEAAPLPRRIPHPTNASWSFERARHRLARAQWEKLTKRGDAVR